MRRVGLVRYRHWLAFGFDHGFGTWLPDPVKRATVASWNHVACSLLGHDTLVQWDRGGSVDCVSCLRSIRDPGEGVVRVWELPR